MNSPQPARAGHRENRGLVTSVARESGLLSTVFVLSDMHRQARPAADAGGVSALGVVVVDFPVGPSGEHFLKRNACLNTRQCSTQAEVDAVPEGQMCRAPVDVESIGVGELAFIAVRGSVEQQHYRPFGYRLPIMFDVTGHVTRLHG